MAKASGKTSIECISLRDARTFTIEAYGASHLTERLLTEWLAARKVRWRCELVQEGQGMPPRKFDAQWGDPAFWRRTNPGSGLVVLYINWEESWARRDYWAYAITVSRADVLAQLPTVPSAGEKPKHRRKQPQADRVRRALPRAYPPSGKVPDEVRTATVQGRVAKVLGPESKALGLPDPSWEVVARVLERKE